MGFEKTLLVTRTGELFDQPPLLCSQLSQQFGEDNLGFGGHGRVLPRRRKVGGWHRLPPTLPCGQLPRCWCETSSIHVIPEGGPVMPPSTRA